MIEENDILQAVRWAVRQSYAYWLPTGGLERGISQVLQLIGLETIPCDISAWTDLAPFSWRVRAARERVVPVSIMSSTRIAT